MQVQVNVVHPTGELVVWNVPVDERVPHRYHMALARLPRPCAARRLKQSRRELLTHGIAWFAAGACARFRDRTTLEITTDDGAGPSLVASAADPIALATTHLAGGLRPGLPSSHGLVTDPTAKPVDPVHGLAAARGYLVDRNHGVVAASDVGSLHVGPNEAALLFVLMARGEGVPLSTLGRQIDRPLAVLRQLLVVAAEEKFPLPVVVESGTVEFRTPPLPCASGSRYLTRGELRGLGLGEYARDHEVDAGDSGIYVVRTGGTWWRHGMLVPSADGDQWLDIEGSNMAPSVVRPDLHPCGGSGGLVAAIERIVQS